MELERTPPEKVRNPARELVESYRLARSKSTQWDVQQIQLSKLIAITEDDIKTAHVDWSDVDAVAARAASNGAAIIIITGDTPEVHAQKVREAYQKIVAQQTEESFSRLNRLRSNISNAGLPLDATVFDLERSFARQIDIPFVNQKIDARRAFWILGSASTVVLILIYSLLDSMWLFARKRPSPESHPDELDCLLLYPSNVAVVLGIAWIAAPSVLLAFGMIGSTSVTTGIGEILQVVGLFLATLCIVIAGLNRTLQLRAVRRKV
jgi:hypothetical protein